VIEKQSDDWYWEKTWSNFRRGNKHIRLSWDGGDATAFIYNEGVPETAAAVLACLPLEVPVVHAAWSGDMLMSARQFEIPVLNEENKTRLPRPGDLTWDPKHSELGFVYGTAEAKLPSGPNTLVVYGRVIEDHLERFAQFCRARRFEGLGRLTMNATE